MNKLVSSKKASVTGGEDFPSPSSSLDIFSDHSANPPRPATGRWGRALFRSIASAVFLGMVPVCVADTYTVYGPGENYYTSGSWTQTATLPALTVPAVTIQSITYSFGAAAQISQTFTNNTNFNEYPSASGSDAFTVSLNGSLLATYNLSPGGSTVVAPHSTFTYAPVASNIFSGTLPSVSANPGTVTITGNAVSGPNNTSLGNFAATYEFTLQGATQNSPILPSSIVNNVLYFAGLPGGRWLDPSTASGYEYRVTNAGASITSVTLPTGFGSALRIFIGGQDYGTFAGGSTFTVPAGTTMLDIYGFDPAPVVGDGSGAPTLFDFTGSANGLYDFSMTPLEVPEPFTWAWVLGFGAVLGAKLYQRRRRSA